MKIKIGIAGCLGRMGKELVKSIIEDPGVEFSGGFEHKSHELINIHLSKILNCETNKSVSNDPENIFLNSDVIIDFTTPNASLENIILAEKTHTPLVIGTTGLSLETNEKISKAFTSTMFKYGSYTSIRSNVTGQ